MTVQAIGIEALRAKIEQPRRASLWGQRHTITPLLVEQVFGDGKVLMAIQPLNTRPNYYVVCIDSSWTAESDDDDDAPRLGSDAWFDFLEDDGGIYAAIEDQFGSSDNEPEDGDAPDESPGWPALNLDAGCAWFELDPDKFADREPAQAGEGSGE